MIERLGFEQNKRITKVMNNRRVTATVGGQKHYFRSMLEYRWAQYLEFLKQGKQIIDWKYETKVFDFTKASYQRGPFMYRVDFIVTEKNGSVLYQECKGHHDGSTNSKLQRTLACYPELSKENFELVLQSMPKSGVKGVNRRWAASKYVRRIIDSSEIFKQTKGIINFNAPMGI